MASVTTLYGVKMTALAYRAKSDNGNKGKAKKDKFPSYFLATDCVTTLPGIPEEKKWNYLEGKRSTSNIINHFKFLEEYYYCMPDSDTVNRNAQFLLGTEEAVQTTSIFKRIPFSVIGVYDSNDSGLKWFQPQKRKLTSGYHNYPLKGLNLRYMYLVKKTFLNKLKYINMSNRKWCSYWYVLVLLILVSK